jgi:hypothetical protein
MLEGGMNALGCRKGKKLSRRGAGLDKTCAPGLELAQELRRDVTAAALKG